MIWHFIILKKPELFTSFNLGPLLSNMEKRYWFFINSDLIEKVKKGSGQIFIALPFSYEHHDGNDECGSISQYVGQQTHSFTKKCGLIKNLIV